MAMSPPSWALCATSVWSASWPPATAFTCGHLSKLATVRGWDPQPLLQLGGALTGGVGLRGRSVRRLGLAGGSTAEDRKPAGGRAYRRAAWCVRRDPTYFEGWTCPLKLPNGDIPETGKGASCRSFRPAVRPSGVPRRRRGLRRQPSGPHHRGESNPEAPLSLRAALGGRGGRSGDAHRSPDRES